MKKEKNRKWIWLVVLVVVLPVIGYFFSSNYRILRRYKEEVAKLDQIVAELDKENSLLKKEVEELKYNPLYVERIARRELGMIRPGETIYRVKEKTQIK